MPRGDPEFWSEAEDEVAAVDEKEDGPKAGETDGLEPRVEELKKPIEMTTIYVCRLRRRTGPAVLTALQELVLQMSKVNVPINAIHSDRAREFTAQLRTWLADRQISHKRTSGSEAAGNSTADMGVKWFKARTRALLKPAEAAPTHWPMAAAHAAFGLWKKAFPSSRSSSFQTLAFGQTVSFKAKGYRGVEERKADMGASKDLPARWKKGSYRGPASDVSN